MKKLLFVLLILFLFSVEAAELNLNEVSDYHGRQIKIVAVKEDQAIISVDDTKGIFNNNDEKIIDGIKIKLNEIFYSNDISSVNIELSLTYECGDGKCDEWESSAICCDDCGCSDNKKCVDNECIIAECINHVDCDDGDELTEDKCEDYKCRHKMIKCREDKDCDDHDDDTDDFCKNGRCENIQNWVCKTDEDCDDDNPCTEALCVNKDCQYNVKEDCEVKEEKGEKILEKKGFFARIFNWLKKIF